MVGQGFKNSKKSMAGLTCTEDMEEMSVKSQLISFKGDSYASHAHSNFEVVNRRNI